MAGGTMVLGGLVAGPALAVAGWVLSAKAETAKNEARSNLRKAQAIAEANKASINELNFVKRNADTLSEMLKNLTYDFFAQLLDDLKLLVKSKVDYRKYDVDEKELVHKNLLVAKTIKNIIVTPLLEENGKMADEIREVKMSAKKLLRELKKIDEKYV